MNGWVRIYRQLADHSLWTTERFTRGQAWVDLILMANFTEATAFPGNRPLVVKRGQVLTSQVALARRWRWDRKTVRVFLHALKAAMMLDIQTSKETDTGYTLITLCNYEKFQSDTSEPLAIEKDVRLDIELPIQSPSNPHPIPTSEEGKKGRRATKLRPAGASDAAKGGNGKVPTGYQDVVKHWFDEFQRTRGGNPQFDQAEGAGLKRLLAGHPLHDVKAVMTHMLTRTQLKHIRERHAYTVHSLVGSWNELWSEYRRRAAEEGENA